MRTWGYAAVLLLLALAILAQWPPPSAGLPAWPVWLAWGAFNLFVWHWGIPTRQLGLVSLERLPQVAAVLVFGPIAGGLVSATASLVWPFTQAAYRNHSLAYGALRALHNAAMTFLMSAAAGAAYLAAGGAVPFADLVPGSLWPLAVLALVMQAVNIGCMLAFFGLDGRPLRPLITPAYLLGDLLFVPGGALVALLWFHLPGSVFVLFTVLMAIVVLGSNEVASAREALERRVRERTEALELAVRERDRLVARLEQLTKEDPLTGLANRRQLDERLAEEVERAGRYAHPLSLAIADLDHFKRINDELGHAVGDEVLRVTAGLMRRHCRVVDVVARHGGEEFALVLPETPVEDARTVCEQIRGAIAGFDWATVHPRLRVTVSIGVIGFQAGMDAAGLLARADDNLYAAKRGGRDRVV